MIDQFISCCRTEVGPAQRPGDAAAARLRRPGAGAFQRAHRALPDAVRREQHAGVQLHHAGAIFPPAAPPDVRRARPPRHAQAAGHLHAQEPAAPSARRLHAARFHRPAASREILADRAPPIRTRVSRVVFCSGKIYYDLLAAREERQGRPRRAGARGAALPVRRRARRARFWRATRPTAEVVWAQEEPRNMGAVAFHARTDRSRCWTVPAAKCATWAGRKAPAPPPAPASATSRSRRKLSTTR